MKGTVSMAGGVGAVSALEAREGERREPERDDRALRGRMRPVDPEVLEKPIRRRFTAQYKLRVLEEADGCRELGQLGALLRREGLYSSNLTTWSRQRERGVLEGLSPKKRGRKAKPEDPRDRRIRELEREAEGLHRRLKQAETIVEFQKKVCEILGIPLKGEPPQGPS
jgi:transposase-like protein